MPEKAGSRSGGRVIGRSRESSGRSPSLDEDALPSDRFDIRVLNLLRTFFRVDVASLLSVNSVSLDVRMIFLRAPLVLLDIRSVIDSVRSLEDAPMFLRI